MIFRKLETRAIRLEALASLVVLLFATLACEGEQTSAGAGEAQAERPAATRGSGYSPLKYPLDEAKVRKVAAVMREWDPAGPPPESEDPNELAAYWSRMRAGVDLQNTIGRELLNENSTATIDNNLELMAAIRRQGLSSREFAEAMLAYTNAMGALDVEALEEFYGDESGRPSELQKMMTGVFKDNVELIRRMSEEEDLPSW